MKKIEIHVFPEKKTDRVKSYKLSLFKGVAYVVIVVVALMGFVFFSPIKMFNLFTDAGLRSVKEQNQMVEKGIASIETQINEVSAKAEKLQSLRENAARLGGMGVNTSNSIKKEHTKKSYDNLAEAEVVFRQLLEGLQKNPKVAASVPSIRPLKNERVIKNRFEMIYDPFIEQKVPHRGIDFIAQEGDTVMATGAGIVAEVRSVRGFGATVKLNHTPIVQTFYAHLGQVLVVEGARVSRGDPIAIVGRSGAETSTALHYEIRLKGNPVNPEDYFITR